MFEAPDTDEAPPPPASAPDAGGFRAPDDDADPPKSVGGFAENALNNLGRMVNPINIAKGLGQTIKTGLYDVPKAALESSMDLTKGLSHAIASGQMPDSDEVADAVENSPIIKQTRDMTEPIAKDPVGYAYKNPLDVAALLGGPALALRGGAAAAGDAAEAADAAAETPKVPAPEIPSTPAPDKGLPVIAPGAKTGDPHALFAYNDDFGPDGTPRSIYNVFGDPAHPAIQKVGHGSSVTQDVLDKNGIPITGREPRSVKFEPIPSDAPATPNSIPRVEGNTVTKPDVDFVPGAKFIPKFAPDGIPRLEPMGTKGPPPEPPSRMPQDPNAPKPITPPLSKLSGIPDEIKNYVNSKYQAAQARPGLLPKIGNYLTEESNKLRNKDIGFQPGLMKTMGTGYEGLEKADQLMDYADEKGYFKPGLSDGDRRTQIKNTMDASGAIIGKMRQLADSRGAPDVAGIRSQLETQLKAEYESGVNKAPNEINNVLDEFDKAPKTFQGMTDLATHLNKSATKIGKLGQHPGPTTDAANIVARAANDQARKLFSPEENNLYTQNLRDFGASKKLEQITAAAARRERGARSNQRGVLGRAFQEALDRGGYRMGSNIANRLGKGIRSGRVKTLPQFFEDLAHQSNEEVDDTINSMSKGGIVPGDVRDYVMRRK